MALILKNYQDTVDKFLKLSYDEKVSVCRDSFKALLDYFPDNQMGNLFIVLTQMMGAIYAADSCDYPIERQFIKDVLKVSVVTDEYLKENWSEYSCNKYNNMISEAIEVFPKSIKREFMTIAIGMLTVDGKDYYKEVDMIKKFFFFYDVFDEVFDPYALYY